MTTMTTTTLFQSILDDWAALFYHREEEGLSVIIPLKCEPASDRRERRPAIEWKKEYSEQKRASDDQVRQWFRKVLEDRYGLSSSNNRDKKDSAGTLVKQPTRERVPAGSYRKHLVQEAKTPP
jgi:hypothetical protein